MTPSHTCDDYNQRNHLAWSQPSVHSASRVCHTVGISISVWQHRRTMGKINAYCWRLKRYWSLCASESVRDATYSDEGVSRPSGGYVSPYLYCATARHRGVTKSEALWVGHQLECRWCRLACGGSLGFLAVTTVESGACIAYHSESAHHGSVRSSKLYEYTTSGHHGSSMKN